MTWNIRKEKTAMKNYKKKKEFKKRSIDKGACIAAFQGQEVHSGFR